MLGLATHLIPSARLADVEASLSTVQGKGEPDFINRLLMNFTVDHIEDAPSYIQHLPWIRRIFSTDNLHEVFRRLEEATKDSQMSQWATSVLKDLNSYSPTALWLTSEVLKVGKRLSLKACLQLDAELAHRHMINPLLTDFYAGVNSKLIQKSTQPAPWSPANLLDLDTRHLSKLMQDALEKPKMKCPWIFDTDYEQYPHRSFAMPAPVLVKQAMERLKPKTVNEAQILLMKHFGGEERLGLEQLIQQILADHVREGEKGKLEWQLK